MLTNNFVAYSLKIIFELAYDILLFPVWWYSKGFFHWGEELFNFLSARQKSLGLLVWIKNIHRPMYGQTDWQGVLISFLIRVLQIIIRSFIMLFWVILAFLLLLVWLLAPVLIIYEILFQII